MRTSISETRRDNLIHALGLTSSFGIDGMSKEGALGMSKDGALNDGMEGASSLGACQKINQ